MPEPSVTVLVCRSEKSRKKWLRPAVHPEVDPHPRLRHIHAFVLCAVCRYCSIYVECTTTAKELAHTGLKDIIPDSAGKVGGVIKDILPLPGFIKK